MPRPSRRQIAEADALQLRRQGDFRAAADAVTAKLAAFAEVRRVALFGSVSRPLEREVPRFLEFRQHGIEILHEPKDVDLSVWLSQTSNLAAIGRARNLAVSELHVRTRIGVANHQVDVFLLDHASGRYLGRLCPFSTCPKGKRECLVRHCGEVPFLRRHEHFVFAADALDGAVILLDRETGARALASELSQQTASIA